MPSPSSNKPYVFKCTNCGAPLEGQTQKVTCAYCGYTQFIPTEPETGKMEPPRSGDDHARAGIQAYQQGRYAEAVHELEAAIRIGAKGYHLTDLHTIIGNACLELPDLEKARSCYQTALTMDAGYYKAWVGMGIAYRKSGSTQEAVRCYAEAMRLEPNYAELHTSLGAMYVLQGQGAEAITALERAIKLDPNVAVSHSNMALALALVGRFEEAEQSLRRAIVLGFTNHAVVRERIAALKAVG